MQRFGPSPREEAVCLAFGGFSLSLINDPSPHAFVYFMRHGTYIHLLVHVRARPEQPTLVNKGKVGGGGSGRTWGGKAKAE